MYLTEKHHISKSHKLFAECDRITFLSKNLYNFANWTIRKHYEDTKTFLSYQQIRPTLLKQTDYVALPRKVSNRTLMLLEQNWKVFFKLIKIDKSARPPKFKDSKTGRFIAEYEAGAISIKSLKDGILKLSKTSIEIPIQTKSKIKLVRVVPLLNGFNIEIVYEKECLPSIENNRLMGIDLGLNNLATICSNVKSVTPVILNGKDLKSINHYYNKKKAKLQSKLKGGRKTSKAISRLTLKRNNKINDKLHKKSKAIVGFLVSNQVSKVVIGYNKEWKQEINIGKRNNQNFVNIPHQRFISMIQYKATLAGIQIIQNEESYTSKCSFLDNEEICKHTSYMGSRIKRGLFKSKEKKNINADLNGAYNILKKALPNAFSEGIQGVAVHPVVLTTKN